MWVERITVLPAFLYSSIFALTVFVLTGSSPEKGSSRIISSGSWIIEERN
ncbi:hypothetical protein [Methanosarcina horonobensis]|nr:hypothetical protein [Methanosarcina horonobensis]